MGEQRHKETISRIDVGRKKALMTTGSVSDVLCFTLIIYSIALLFHIFVQMNIARSITITVSRRNQCKQTLCQTNEAMYIASGTAILTSLTACFTGVTAVRT